MSDDPLLPQLLVLLVLLLLSTFFSSAEAVLFSLSESELNQQLEKGDSHAKILLKLVLMPDRLHLTSQLCVTLFSFITAAYCADAFANRLTAWFFRWLFTDLGLNALPFRALWALIVLLMTVLLAFLFLLTSGLAKRAALKKNESAARWMGSVVYLMSVLLWPLVWLLSKCRDGLMHLLRIDPATEAERVSEDKILRMIDLGEEWGAIKSSEKELIENIFEFNDTTAGDIMIHRTDMVMLPADSSDADILQTIQESGLSRFPVYNENADDIIGILNTRDFLLNAQRPKPEPVRALLRPAYFVPESVRSDALFRDMQSRKVHMTIIVDEYGGASGLVTMEDLLEEIVGNIYDEFDPLESREIDRLGENLWRVSGSTDLDALAEELDLELPADEDSETLGGLVFAQISVIPEDGSRFAVDACGLHIEVTKLADRRVEQALVSKRPEVQDTTEK